MRTREVWIHAIDLDNGGAFHDLPTPLLESLLQDVTGTWARRGQGGTTPQAVGPGPIAELAAGTPAGVRIVSGLLADFVAWATGRLRPVASADRHVPGSAPP